MGLRRDRGASSSCRRTFTVGFGIGIRIVWGGLTLGSRWTARVSIPIPIPIPTSTTPIAGRRSSKSSDKSHADAPAGQVHPVPFPPPADGGSGLETTTDASGQWARTSGKNRQETSLPTRVRARPPALCSINGRASSSMARFDFGSEGCRFEPCRPHHSESRS